VKITRNFIHFLDAIPYFLNRLSKAYNGTGAALKMLSILITIAEVNFSNACSVLSVFSLAAWALYSKITRQSKEGSLDSLDGW